MNSKMKRYMGVFFLIILWGFTMTARPVLAASAQVQLSSDSEQVNLGDEFFVYVEITSQTSFGDFEGSITYDDDILEYQGGSSQVKGSSGYLTISDMDNTLGSTKRKYTLKFEATQVGMCKLAFPDRAIVYELEGGEMSVSNNVLTINVAAPKTASDNGALKSLKVSPSVLKPEFEAGIHDYTVEADSDTEQLVIVALPEDEKASVTIAGNEALKEGENKITISVLAESGKVIEYSINAIKAAAPEVTGAPEEVLPPENTAEKFEIIESNGDKYFVYSGQYKLLETEAETLIPEGYVMTKLIISGSSVTAFYPQGDMESDFLLIYAENPMGEAGFYRYDRIERTLQRYTGNDKITVEEAPVIDEKDRITYEKYRTNLTQAAIAIALLSAFCILFLVICIRLYLKSRGYKEDDLE